MPDDDIKARTPDGVVHRFPAGTPPAVVDGAVKKYLSEQSSKKYVDNLQPPRAGLTDAYNPDMENFAEKHPVIGTPLKVLDAIGGGAMNAVASIPGAVYDQAKSMFNPFEPSDMEKGVTDSAVQWITNPNVRKAAPSLLPEAIGGSIGNFAGGEITGKVLPKVASTGPQLLSKAKPALVNMSDAAIHPTQIPGKAAKWIFNKIPDAPNPQALEQFGSRMQQEWGAPLGSAENPAFSSKLPARLPVSLRGDPFNPKSAPTIVTDPFQVPEEAAVSDPFSPSRSGSPSGNDLISRTKKLVVPGEEPTAADIKRAGDLTQAPLNRLQQLAKFGDRLAQNEINRRLQNQ